MELEMMEEQWKQMNEEHVTELNTVHHNELEQLKAQFTAELNSKNEEIERLGMDLLFKVDEVTKVSIH
jgi:hypothetical protein